MMIKTCDIKHFTTHLSSKIIVKSANNILKANISGSDTNGFIHAKMQQMWNSMNVEISRMCMLWDDHSMSQCNMAVF